MGRRLKAAAAALVLALFLTGCTTGEAITLHDTSTLYIEREGDITRIVDRAGDDTYTLKTVRQHRQTGTAAQISEATTTADTDTLRLQTVGGLIIVTDKTTGTTLYIKGARH